MAVVAFVPPRLGSQISTISINDTNHTYFGDSEEIYSYPEVWPSDVPRNALT